MKFRNIKHYKNQIIGAVLALVIVFGGVFLLASLAGQPEAKKQQVTESAQFDHLSYVARKGATALTQLKETTDGVVTKSSTYGEYVDSIGSLKGGTGGKYWTFYVDGKMAAVGAGKYIAKGGEEIEWKFEKAQ